MTTETIASVRDTPTSGVGVSIAVLIPCHNEEHAIASVVRAFRAALPTATVFVYDNNSSDETERFASAAGAVVRHESRQGKGHVVRRMFADVDADVYVIVDGDGTYDADAAPAMIDRLLYEQLDMVVATRNPEEAAHRRGHTLGNRFFNHTLRLLFGSGFTDVFSGYRVMSRRFVKSMPVTSSGFEIETEITAHAVDVGASTAEQPTAYGARHEDSSSKLRTFPDGMRILRKSLMLFKEMRPLRFFTIIGITLTIVAFAVGARVVYDFVETSKVPRLPSAVLAATIQLVAVISFTAGIILDSVGRARREARRLAYLAIPPSQPS